ncbi:MAG: aspartate ammonia-lyase, partial [Acinetobacter sp.]|nr:aspartate ammonia-lyase [Acinetobacter sp.]
METVQPEVTRIEKDLLGSKEVPINSYYGIHTIRALENFNISKHSVGEQSFFIRALAQVKKASAQTNLQFNKISEEISVAIQKASDQLIENPQNWKDAFPSDVYQGGAGTSINMNTNEVIANIALESLGYAKGRYDIIHPNDHVNKSQSTNDVYPTALRLATYYSLDLLFEKIN